MGVALLDGLKLGFGKATSIGSFDGMILDGTLLNKDAMDDGLIVGSELVGFKRVGLKLVGLELVGVKRVGVKLVGLELVGFKRVGLKLVGFKRVGLKLGSLVEFINGNSIEDRLLAVAVTYGVLLDGLEVGFFKVEFIDGS